MPSWVESDEEKAGYAFIIIFSFLASVFFVLTIAGCIMGKVRHLSRLEGTNSVELGVSLCWLALHVLDVRIENDTPT